MSAPEHGRTGRVRWVAYIAVGLLVVVLAGVAGFFFGGAQATTPEDPRRAHEVSRREAEIGAYRTAHAEARKRGRQDGLREGRRAGRRDAEQEVERRAAQPAPAPADVPDGGQEQRGGEGDCPPGEQPITRMGVTYCGRPGPARPEDCPSGSEPVGETGACAPKED